MLDTIYIKHFLGERIWFADFDLQGTHLRNVELRYPKQRCHPWGCKRWFAIRGSSRSPPRKGKRWSCPAEGSRRSASRSQGRRDPGTRCGETLKGKQMHGWGKFSKKEYLLILTEYGDRIPNRKFIDIDLFWQKVGTSLFTFLLQMWFRRKTN